MRLFIAIIGFFLFFHPLNAQIWEATKKLTWTPGESQCPSVVIESTSTIHLIYQDDTPGNYEIYHKKSTKAGTSWSTNRLTWISYHS